MCTLPALPPLGVAWPWQAPVQWVLFMLALLGTGVIHAVTPRGLRRQWGHLQTPGRVLFLISIAAPVVALAVLLLVIVPADDTLYAWSAHVHLNRPGCDFDAIYSSYFSVYDAREGQIDRLFWISLALSLISSALGLVQYRAAARRARRNGSPLVALPNR